METTKKMAMLFEPRICIWEDLSLTDVEKLLKCGSTVEAMHGVLRDILGLQNKDNQCMIELDLYTYAVFFAKNNAFSAPQTSAFFTILKSVHMLCISTPFDNQEQALGLFNNLMIRHGVTRPPYSVALFTLQQVTLITDYVLSSYFKHYKLYKYAFTKRVRLDLKVLYDGQQESETVSQVSVTVPNEEAKKEVEETEEACDKDEADQTAASPPKDESTETANNDLREMVSSTLSKKLKSLETTIEQEMTSHDLKLSGRIEALEQLVVGKTTKQKKAA